MVRWCLTLLLPLTTLAAEKEKLLVLSIIANDDSSKHAARMVEDQVLTELGSTGRFEVMGQSELGALLGIERQKALLGCGSSECLVELGGSLNARWAVMGSVGRFGTKLRLDLKVSDMRSGQVVHRAGQVIERDDDLFAAVTAQLKAMGLLDAAPGSPASAASAGSTRPWLLLGAGGLAAAGGGVLMGLGSSWAASLNTGEGLNVTLSDARSRLGLFQVLYWGGAALIAGGLLCAVFGIVDLVQGPAEPKGSVGVTLSATASGLEVRW